MAHVPYTVVAIRTYKVPPIHSRGHVVKADGDEVLRSAVRKAVSLESGCAKALAAKVSMHGPRVSAYYVDMYALRMTSMVCVMWRL